MIVVGFVGFVGLVSVASFVAWVVFHEPWVRSHGDPAGPNAAHRSEQMRRQRRLVTRRALERLRDERDQLDAVERSDYFRAANTESAGCVVNPSLDAFSRHVQAS